MEQFKHFVLTVLVALVSNISAFAYDFEVDGIYYNTLSLQDLTCEVTSGKYEGYSGDIVIPSSVTYAGKTFKITSIGSCAFSGSHGLTSINIPNSVTSLVSQAFSYCSSLTSINIPNSVTKIGDYAFLCCSGLTSVTIGNSVTSIGNSAFYECSSLTSIIIPSSVNSISLFAFKKCYNLKEITSLNTTPPRIYNETFDGVSKTECVLKVPDEAISAYQSADIWKTFWNIVGLNGGSGDEPETKKCAEPEIALVAGKIVAISETENSTCYTSITSEDFKGVDTNNPISLSGVYTITSYAHAEGYQNSDTVTMLLYWSKPSLDGETEMTLVGDLNGDGKVNVADLNLVIDIMCER